MVVKYKYLMLKGIVFYLFDFCSKTESLTNLSFAKFSLSQISTLMNTVIMEASLYLLCNEYKDIKKNSYWILNCFKMYKFSMDG